MGIYQKILAGKVYFPKYFDKNAKVWGASEGPRVRGSEGPRVRGSEGPRVRGSEGPRVGSGRIFRSDSIRSDPKALVKKLLVADLSKRFGNLKDGSADILKHKWFESYELSKLEAFEVPAPYKPSMKDWPIFTLQHSCLCVISHDSFHQQGCRGSD